MTNIADLLRNTKKGTMLWSPLFGPVEFMQLGNNDEQIWVKVDHSEHFDKYGRYFGSRFTEAECQLFPSKDCRTWEGWTPPVEPKFKVGDWIVRNNGSSDVPIQIYSLKKDRYLVTNMLGSKGEVMLINQDKWNLWSIEDVIDGDILSAKIDGDDYILIFKQIKDDWIETYGHYYITIDKFCAPTQMFCRDYQGTLHPATKKQRKTFFKKMHNEGYDWDPDKKELHNIIKPKYKVGDVVIYKEIVRTITRIIEGYYEFDGWNGSCPIEKQDELLLINPAPKFKVGDEIETGNTKETIAEVGYTIRSYYCESGRTIYFANQDLWHLVPKSHYDVSNFNAGMPVLVRADNNCRWDYSVFSRITGNVDWPFAVCNGVSFTQCIPFEGNETLLGTTDMCDERFINW